MADDGLTIAREVIGDSFVQAEFRQEMARLATDKREADRESGVRWGGACPLTRRPARTVAEMLAAADKKRAAASAFSQTPRGRFLEALTALEAMRFYGPADKARSAYWRGFADVNAPVSVGEVAVALNALNPIAGEAAQAARAALAELLLEQHRRAA